MSRRRFAQFNLILALTLVMQSILPILFITPPPVAFAAEAATPTIVPSASVTPLLVTMPKTTPPAPVPLTATLTVTPPMALTPTQTVTPTTALPPAPTVTPTALIPTPPISEMVPSPDVREFSPRWYASTTLSTAGFRMVATDTQPARELPRPEDEQPTLPPLTLELSADAQPRRVTPGEVLTYTISAIHTGQEPLRDVTITDILPVGVVFVSKSAPNFEYVAKENALYWRLAELQPGVLVTGSFQVSAQGLRMGDVISNTVTASSPQADGVARSGVVVDVVPPVTERVTATATEGGWLRATDGKVEVKLPPGAVSGRQTVTYQSFPADRALPGYIRQAFMLTATDETRQPVTRLRAPAMLLYPWDAGDKPESLIFYTLDEATGDWKPLPTAVDYIHRIITSTTEHFNSFAVGAAAAAGPNYQFDPGSRIKGARPQLFSGSISYGYDFALPPGRGGLTPALGLSYSSSRHQRETGHYNVVGHGWDILGENYVAKADPVNPDSSALNIVLNGATYTINTSNPWFVKENPFIQAWEYVTPCITGVNGTCPSWLGTTNFPYYRLRIRTSDGMRYTFQGMALVSSNAPVTAGEPPMIYRWRDNTCNPGTGGQWPDLVRMPLVEVLDPSGNKIVYNWEATASNTQGRHGSDDARPDDHNCNYVRNIRLTEILYNYVNTSPQVRIQLRYDVGQPAAYLRWDRPQYFPVNNPSLFAIYILLGVDVKVVDGSNVLQTVRQYDLTYHDQCNGGCEDKASTLLLPKEIKEATPATGAAPLVTAFSYDANKLLTTQCDYGYLNTITGPYGGQVVFTATRQAVNCTTPRPPAIISHTLKDLVTNQQWTWDYATTDWNQDAHGYAQVNALAPELGDGTRRLEQHYFHTMTPLGSASIDHLAGREYKSVTCLPQAASPSAACSTELQRTEINWLHATVDLPLDPVYIYLPAEQQPRFVYAQLIDTYAAGQRLLRTRDYYQTWRQGSSGKQYGNLTERQENIATATDWAWLPTRTRYSYYYPTTVYWIFNKVAQTLLYQGCAGCGGEKLEGSSVSYYDNAISPTTSPTLGRLTQQSDGSASSGETFTKYTYYANGNLWQVIDAKGGITETFYDDRFQVYPVCVKNPKGQLTKQRYYSVPGSTNAGCTTAAGDPAWSGTTQVDGRFFGMLQDETDANNVATTYRWDTQGRIAKVIRPGDDDTNPTLRFNYTMYGGQNQPFWIKQEARDNAPGAATTYLETRTFYDGLGQVIQTQTEGANSGQSHIVSTQYNAEGQALKQNLPYFGSGLTTYVPPDWTKPTTQTTYDVLGRAKVVTAPDGTYTQMLYTVDFNAGDPDFATPARSVYTIDAKNHFVRRSYDAFNNLRMVTELTGEWGQSWGAEYRTRYTYDTQGRLTQVKDAANNATSITYDLLGRKIQMADPDMGAWSYGYDIVSNLVRQTDARGQTICFFYDELKRLTAKSYQTNTACPTSPPASPAVSYAYDGTAGGNQGIGRRTGMTDQIGSTSWFYDSRGRMTSETRIVDGASYVTDTAYDSADRAATLTYPVNASGVREGLSYAYDAAGQLIQVRSDTYSTNYASGLTYNALGQLSEITYGNAVQEHRGYYGLGGNWDSRPGTGLQFYGKLWRSRAQTSAGTPLFDLRYLYDNAGNLTRSQTAATGTTGFSVISFWDSFDVQNVYDWNWSNYQLVPHNDGGSNVVLSTGTGSGYDANFYRSAYSLSTGKGVSIRFKVDRTDTLMHLSVETDDANYRRFGVIANQGKLYVQYNDGAGWRYPADLLANLQVNTWYVLRILLDDTRGFFVEAYQLNAPTVRGSYQQPLPAGLTWRFRHWIYSGNAYLDDYSEFNASSLTWQNDERLNFGYDALNRLSSAAPDSGAQGYNQTYQYTAIGNLTYRSDVGSYTYPPSGSGSVRPHAATAAGANMYSYDANGNMLTRTENSVTYTQTWDEENRLKTVTVNGQTTTYTYNGDGQRVKKTQGGQTTVYIGAYYEKHLSTGAVTTYYYAGGQRVAQRQATSTVYYFVSDHLGSTSLTTNASGSEVGRQRYYPFGQPRNPSGALNTDYRFTGQRSEETNLGSLYDYGGRFYSPVLGRFLSADSIVPRPGDPQSLNRYSYARNNPLIRVDPSGHADCAADDRACWEDEWQWKNRWYNAHGWYADDEGGWGTPGAPSFKDVGIANDVLAEAGVYLSGLHPSGIKAWSKAHIMQMAFGVSLFASRLQGGMDQLRRLLGGPVDVSNSSCLGAACAPPHARSVRLPASWPIDQVASAFVHELAHVIDWSAGFLGGFSAHWGYAPLTNYAAGDPPQSYPLRWDRWAEAVTVWVFGGTDALGNFATSYKTQQVGDHVKRYGIDLNVQMNRMTELLNGWR